MRRRFPARLSIAIASSMLGLAAHAQTASDTVKIGVLTDMSGPYSGMGGPGSLVAAKMAIDDCLKATRTSPTSLPRRRANGSTATRSRPSSTSPTRRSRWRCRS